MVTIWKRNAVVITVLVFVCVAVYLNWSYARLGDADTGKNLGQATLVDGKDAEAAIDEADIYANSTLSDYFATARLTRQQARDSALALLNETASAKDAAQSIRDVANESIQAMAAYTLAEAQIENLITAKGFSDCITFMGEDGISVVVAPPAGGLTTADVAKITDIVTEQTHFTTEQIRIVEAN